VNAYVFCEEKLKKIKGGSQRAVDLQVEISHAGSSCALARAPSYGEGSERLGATQGLGGKIDNQERSEERRQVLPGGKLEEPSGGRQEYRKESHDSGDAEEEDSERSEGRGGSRQDKGTDIRSQGDGKGGKPPRCHQTRSSQAGFS
jgi:hypothetical protein